MKYSRSCDIYISVLAVKLLLSYLPPILPCDSFKLEENEFCGPRKY